MGERTTGPSTDQRLLEESLGLLAPVAEELIATFYDRLFADYPQLRPMFPEVLDAQREQLLQAVIALVTQYDHPEELLPRFEALGRRHDRYGARLDHYAAVGATLLATLREYAGPAWNAEYEGAWLRAYTFAAGSMMQAGIRAERAMADHIAAGVLPVRAA